MTDNSAHSFTEGNEDFDQLLESFMESFSFQIPYNGTNNFYSEERLKMRPMIKRELKKIWTDHILPRDKRIDELEKENRQSKDLLIRVRDLLIRLRIKELRSLSPYLFEEIGHFINSTKR